MGEEWVTVPVEPTDEMLQAALQVHGNDAVAAAAPALLSALLKIYRAMLAAAPKPDDPLREILKDTTILKAIEGKYPATPKPDDKLARLQAEVERLRDKCEAAEFNWGNEVVELSGKLEAAEAEVARLRAADVVPREHAEKAYQQKLAAESRLTELVQRLDGLPDHKAIKDDFTAAYVIVSCAVRKGRVVYTSDIRAILADYRKGKE